MWAALLLAGGIDHLNRQDGEEVFFVSCVLAWWWKHGGGEN